jgi:hypothetical protein
MTPDEQDRYDELLAAVKYLRARLAEAEARRFAPAPAAGTKAKPKAGPMRMRFGKHKGTPVRDVPPDYARWLLGKLREKTLAAGRFVHPCDHLLGTELMKAAFDLDDLDAGVDALIVAHKEKHPTFDDAAFRAWLGADRTKGKKLRTLWLGVAFVNGIRRRSESIRKYDERIDEMVPAN